ncbi:hypothetical protein BELL_0395g00030 [Botrytis elliptica]|uniref:Uncharacterized protein n=1 Tax=Botrytis elliptica TaxID=278938 RepID=A0A4Z1JV67_9HELO|nr:hypothetical protein BELL_0395g00030 [Botrytis elliptica]
MSQEFDAFSQKVGITSLEEAKNHLQNLGPVPRFPDRHFFLANHWSMNTYVLQSVLLRAATRSFYVPSFGASSPIKAFHLLLPAFLQTLGYQAWLTPSISPAEIEIRKLVEQEENKIIQEEHKSIRRDSISFLKRRTSERKTNLATPTLTITTESLRNSPMLSPAISPARSPTPPDSAVTLMDLAASILGSSSTADMVASPYTLQSDEEQTVPARDTPITSYTGDTPITSYTGPFGIRNLLTPIEQANTNSQGQADEHAAKNFTSSSSGSAKPVFPPRVSSMAPPPPNVVAGWVGDGYTSNYGTPSTSAAQTMGAHPWQQKTASFTATPIVLSSSQPDTPGSCEATSDLISSSDGSVFEFCKKRANNNPVAEMELEHKKTKPDALNAHGVESSDGISGVPSQQ